MIFVTFGTHRLPFQRLARRVREGLEAGDVARSQLLIQCGHTPVPGIELGASLRDFLNPEEYAGWMTRASIVVTHGGTGSVIRALESGKRLIVAPRRAEFGEVSDDHQVDMAREMREGGYCVEWDLESQSLGQVLRAADTLPGEQPSFSWPSLLPRLRDHMVRR